jgi:hypothetical protein
MNPVPETKDRPTTPNSNVPAGYSVRQMPDGQNYVVPNFLINSTDLAVQTQAMKEFMEVQKAPGGVSHISLLKMFGAGTFSAEPLWCRYFECRITLVPVHYSCRCTLVPIHSCADALLLPMHCCCRYTFVPMHCCCRCIVSAEPLLPPLLVPNISLPMVLVLSSAAAVCSAS